MAGADNFNPDLKVPPPREYIPLPSLPAAPPDRVAPSPGANSGLVEGVVKPATAGVPFAILEGLQSNIQNNRNNSGQVNQIIESTAILRLNNGDRILFTTGYDTYEQIGTKTVNNILLGINWETKINSLKIRYCGTRDDSTEFRSRAWGMVANFARGWNAPSGSTNRGYSATICVVFIGFSRYILVVTTKTFVTTINCFLDVMVDSTSASLFV